MTFSLVTIEFNKCPTTISVQFMETVTNGVTLYLEFLSHTYLGTCTDLNGALFSGDCFDTN